MKWLGLMLVAIPFVFAALRAFSTGTDFRYVWVALAAATAAVAVFAYSGRTARPALSRSIVALVASTVSASAVGFLLGARSVPAVLFVGFGFAICEAGGLALVHRARFALRRAPE